MVMISLAPVHARRVPRVVVDRRQRQGGRGAMERPEPQRRIPAVCALLLVATLLGIVWLTPLGSPPVRLGCVDCHGGDPTAADRVRAHVWPRHPEAWRTSANPVRTYTLLNHESPEFVRFINPGDLRIAHLSCGTVNCHPSEV